MEQNRIGDCSVNPAGMSLSQDKDRYYPVSLFSLWCLLTVDIDCLKAFCPFLGSQRDPHSDGCCEPVGGSDTRRDRI